ncbi:hypothetical protein FNF29_04940 [Cafeteria roenbergensis]|uniref:K Homology domain-containing protein n=1 Tax=Cafeteria roenbergensis TaxID=33653 RepID=A0A5A8CCQ8_CAFRO|nr:hypothetical protein FNF29_04940 [Cafeteria roenbergensis]|eukprot:KAA0150826.1 hypothetical protein FNF29_04940 [Cafeteria roenbergensis]
MQSSSSHSRGGHGSGGGGSGGGGGSAHPAVPPGMGLERGHGHGHGHGAYAPGGAPAGPRPPAPDQLEAPTGVHGGGYPASSAGGHPGGPPHGYSGAHPGYQPGPEAYGAAGYPAGYGHAPQGYSAPPGYAPYPSSYGQAGYGDGHHDGGVPSSAAEYSEAYGAGGGSGGGYGGAPEGTEFTQQQQAQFARSFGYSGPSGPYRPAFATVPSGPGYDRPWARAPAAPAVSIVPQHAEQIDVPRDLVDWVTSGGWAELEEQLTTSLSDRLHIEGATLSLSSHRPGAAIITVSVPGHLAVALRAFIPLAHAILGHQQHRIREEQETRRLREDYEAAMREQELGLRAEFTVPTEVLGLVIGKQGANINRVRTETGVDRIVTEDDGTVRVRGPSREHVALARSLLEFTVEDLHISPQQAARLRDREEGLDRVRRDTGVVRLELAKNVLRPMDGAKAETEPGSARGPAVRVTGLKSAVVGCIALLTEEMRFEEEAALRRSQQRKQQRELESIDRAYGDLAPARRGGKDRRGGALFALIGDSTPPLLKASWRLWATAALQAPWFALQLRTLARTQGRPAVCTYARSVIGLCGIGVFLAVHFGAWVWSIDNTSLTHSLLFVTAHPVLIIAAAWAQWAASRALLACGCMGMLSRGPARFPAPVELEMAAAQPSNLEKMAAAAEAIREAQSATDTKVTEEVAANGAALEAETAAAGDAVAPLAPAHALLPRRPTWLETLGTGVGAAGAVLMVVLVAGQESNVTLAGDMVALLGAAAMAVYLSAGRHYRAELKLPLFLYAAPVTLFAAISLSAASLAIEGPSHGVALSTGPARLTLFGWLVDGRLALLVCALGLVSGILGHTLANLSLARLPSLVVSVSLLLEPVVGSLIGYAAGVQAVPHAWTFVGGAVLLVGAGMVTVGGKRDSAPHDPAPAQQSHPAEIELSV